MAFIKLLAQKEEREDKKKLWYKILHIYSSLERFQWPLSNHRVKRRKEKIKEKEKKTLVRDTQVVGDCAS